jgi:hypothetical protein
MSLSDRDSTLMTTGRFITYALYRKRSYMRLLFPLQGEQSIARVYMCIEQDPNALPISF